MKKRLLIALAVVLLLSLAGCGKSEKKAGLANKDIIGIWQCTAALESMDSYSKFYEEAKRQSSYLYRRGFKICS